MVPAVSDTAAGTDVVAQVMGTNAPQAVRDISKSTGELAENPKLQGNYNSISDVHGASDFGNYLIERMGETLGGLGGFLGADLAVGAGTTAVAGPAVGGAASLATVFGMSTLQGIGSANKTLLADEGIKKLVADGKLSSQDIAKLSIIPGIASGVVTTGMIKIAGMGGNVTENLAKDVSKKSKQINGSSTGN